MSPIANIKAGTVYVDVKLGSVENLKRDLKKEMEDAGHESGRNSGESFSEEFTETIHKRVKTKVKETFEEEVGKRSGRDSGEKYTDNFQKSFSERVGRTAAIMRGNLLAALLPVLVAAGPFIGGALGGAIIAALPLAAMAGGIALVAKDPQIKAAGTKLGQELMKGLQGAAQVLIQPVLSAIDLIRKRFPELLKPIQGMFLAVSQFIMPLANTLVNVLLSVLNGMNTAVQKSKPIFDVFLKGLERLGVVLGDFFKKLASDPEAIEGMADALDDLFGVLVLVIKWFGNFIISASRAYAQFKDAWGGIKSWFTGTIVPSLSRAWDQLKAALGAVGKFFADWWDKLRKRQAIGIVDWGNAGKQLYSTAKQIVSNLTATLSALPDKIVGYFKNLGTRLYTAGRNAMQGFLKGIADMAEAILAKAQGIANNVISTITSALKIGSPSKVMEQIGQWTIQGFVNGMDKMNPVVNAYLPEPIQRITNDFGSPGAPQMDMSGGGAAISIGTYVANDNMDPWRQAEDWYFMVTARGGIA